MLVSGLGPDVVHANQPRQPSRPGQHVLIVGERRIQRTSDQLAEELELMGFSVSTLPGDEDAAEEALDRSDLAAVVFLSDEESAVRIWVLEDGPDDEDGAPEPVEIDVADGGSRETFALRTAELLRGRLMPTAADSSREGAGDTPDVASFGDDDVRFSAALGPALIASSYASTSLAVSGDVAFAIAPRLMLGPYVLGSLDRHAWSADPERYSVRQVGGGAKLRYALTLPASEIHAHLLARVGIRRLSLRTESGPPPERTTGSVSGPTFGLGVEGSYPLSRWLRLGADTTFVAGFPIWDSFTTNPDLSPGQRRQAEAAGPGPGPDFQWVTTILLSAHW